MNILVIGGAGYIGAHIVDLLCDRGYNVVVFDNLSSGFKGNLNKKAKFTNGDILNQADLYDLFSSNKFDALIHMAALKSANESMILPDLYTTNNVVGSFNIISHAIKSKIKKIIFSSTAAVYGKPLYNPIDEKHQTNPINHYGYTKLCVENHLSWMSKINDMKYVSLRYFNAAGYTDKEDLIRFKENNPQNLLPIIMEVANNKREKLEIFGNDYNTKDGTCIRDYINVVDLADAHVKALEYLESGFSCNLNLSTGRGYSVLDVVNTAKEITGKDIPFTFSSRRVGDPEILISSYAKANEKLKWIPVKSSLEQLIKSMWKYYR